MKWRIEQHGVCEWAVRKGHDLHFAQNPEDAVRLMRALEAAEAE